MNPIPIEQAKTPNLAQSMPALRRAAQKAQELARQTGTEAATASHPSGKKEASHTPAKFFHLEIRHEHFGD